jgi:hypothetical protein
LADDELEKRFDLPRAFDYEQHKEVFSTSKIKNTLRKSSCECPAL